MELWLRGGRKSKWCEREKWNKKKLKWNCGWEEEEKVNDVKEKNENKMK